MDLNQIQYPLECHEYGRHAGPGDPLSPWGELGQRHEMGSDKSTSVPNHGRPPEALLDEMQIAVETRMASETGLVPPLQDLRPDWFWHEQCIRRSTSRIKSGAQRLSHFLLHLPRLWLPRPGKDYSNYRFGVILSELAGQCIGFGVLRAGMAGEGEVEPPQK